MIELYHHGSSVCAAKVRFTLLEKAVPWESRYIDILKGEQFEPGYLALNPMAVVPTLVHDGEVLVESTVICEYLDDAFAERPLKPSAALERARMRAWTKAVDEHIHPACKYITYAACHRHIIRRMPTDKFEQYMRGPQSGAETRVAGDPNWVESKRAIVQLGVAAPGVAAKFRMYDTYLNKMEETLANHRWLAGPHFSLADIALAPYVNRLDMLSMNGMWIASRPRVTDWFERIKARPTFKVCFLDYCPPDLVRDLNTFGTQSWPEVKAILAE